MARLGAGGNVPFCSCVAPCIYIIMFGHSLARHVHGRNHKGMV